MRDLVPEKSMTIKEVAEELGVSRDLIEKRVKELFPNKMQKGKTTYLNEYEVTSISSRLKENTSLISASDDRRMLPKTELEEDILIREAYQILLLREQKSRAEIQDLKIQLDYEKSWYSVKRVKNMGYLPDMKVHHIWRPLKKWCIENNRQIRTIFDANYGDVKTYHADAWHGVYGLDLNNDKECEIDAHNLCHKQTLERVDKLRNINPNDCLKEIDPIEEDEE